MSYREQFIWQKAVDLSVRCYKLTDYFPKSETYGMVSQTKAEGERQMAEGFLFGRGANLFRRQRRGLYPKGRRRK